MLIKQITVEGICDPIPCESRTTQLNSCSLSDDNENNKCFIYIEENRCYSSCPSNTEEINDTKLGLICKEVWKGCELFSNETCLSHVESKCVMSGEGCKYMIIFMFLMIYLCLKGGTMFIIWDGL
jgi:hypothetical protein